MVLSFNLCFAFFLGWDGPHIITSHSIKAIFLSCCISTLCWSEWETGFVLLYFMTLSDPLGPSPKVKEFSEWTLAHFNINLW